MILSSIANGEEKGDGTAWLDSRDQSRLADSVSPLLLASASPRRRALLADAGVAYEIAAADVIELRPGDAPNLDAAQVAEVNAGLKARAAWRPERWVLGADTVVTLDGRVFGKPATLRP